MRGLMRNKKIFINLFLMVKSTQKMHGNDVYEAVYQNCETHVPRVRASNLGLGYNGYNGQKVNI